MVWLKASGLNVANWNHSDFLLHAGLALVNFNTLCMYKTSEFYTILNVFRIVSMDRHEELG